MALYLVELTPAQPSKDEATALIETVNSSLTNGAELIETPGLRRPQDCLRHRRIREHRIRPRPRRSNR